ncbi:hypothetical protein QR77_41230 [Streptomyces sp. 150FB]|uniref:hypothetical protein n=1 Tax=Streptomyces sp. 150FB TaxID=1576605 RepID=UPI0005893C29|nr:hypothetical protein [Streptomyces sp. 150FB]KIF72723.1 hypothetical protein QR77_41230 [Streptomyces sp. 150FB]
MGLVSRAAPGVEKQAERAAESACHLADAVTPTAWSTVAAEDALEAIDVLTTALSQISPDTATALAAVAAATNAARHSLGLPVGPEPDPQGKEAAVPGPRAGDQPAPRGARQRPRRRGLGPGFQGIHTER